MDLCTRCGTPLTEDMIVCEYCGQPVGTPQPTVVLSKMPETPPPPKPNKTPVIVLSIVCAVLTVAVVVLSCLLILPDSDDQNGAASVTTTTVPTTTVTDPTATTTAATANTTVTMADTTSTTVSTTDSETTTTTKAVEIVTPAELPLAGSQGQVDTEDGDGVNVRSGPSTDYEVVGGVAEDKTVDLLAEQDGWYYVECEDGFGWILGEFLKFQ